MRVRVRLRIRVRVRVRVRDRVTPSASYVALISEAGVRVLDGP